MSNAVCRLRVKFATGPRRDALGLSGVPDAAERRAALLRKLDLPEHMSAKALLAALNALYTPGELDELLGSQGQ